MLASLPHCFSELAPVRSDVLPERRRKPDRGGVAFEVPIHGEDDSPLRQAWQDRVGKEPPNFIVAKRPGFALGVGALYAQPPQVVLTVVGGHVSDPGDAFIVGGADNGVDRKTIDLLVLRGSSNQRANALGQPLVIAHRRMTGGFDVAVLGCVVVAGLAVVVV